jgi:hypothetical protein
VRFCILFPFSSALDGTNEDWHRIGSTFSGVETVTSLSRHSTMKGSFMKKTLIALGAAIALVGCDQNRGGLGDSNNRDTGGSSSRDTTYPGTRSESSILSTNTNSVTPTPSPAESEAAKPSQSGTDSYNNIPKN